METNQLLYFALIIYIIIMAVATLFRVRWLYMVAGLLWFIPIVEIDNATIKIVASAFFLTHAILAFYNKDESEDF